MNNFMNYFKKTNQKLFKNINKFIDVFDNRIDFFDKHIEFSIFMNFITY